MEKTENCNGNNGEKPLLSSDHAKESFKEILKPKIPENSNYCTISLIVSVASSMLSTGIAVGALNPALILLTKFFNETNQLKYNESLNQAQSNIIISLSVSMLLAGGFFGALSIGFILKIFTRKNSMILMNITNLVAVIIMTVGGYYGQSPEAIIVGRFIMGLFSGFGMNLIPIVVAECSAQTTQTFYLSMIGVDLSLGGVIGLLFGYEGVLGNSTYWPILLSLSAFPSVVYLAFSPCLPESPSYLIRQGRNRRARNVLWKLRRNATEEDISNEVNAIQSYQQMSGDVKQVPLFTMFKLKHYRRQLVVVVMVFLQAQLCGINAIGMYSNRIFEEAGFIGQAATYASTIVYAVQFIFACGGSFVVGFLGPKPINITSGTIMAISIAVLTMAMTLEYKILSVVAVTTCVVSWACGINVTLFPMLSAFTTETTRETAFLFGGGIFWIFSWLVSFIPPYLLTGLKTYAFLPFCFLNVVFVIYVAIFLPNTRNKSSSDIQTYIQEGNYLLKKKRKELVENSHA